MLVARPDGVLQVPVGEPGEYSLASVKDARRCSGVVNGHATVTQHPRSKAGFTKNTHSMCAGDSVKVEIRVAGEGAPPPWQVTVLRDEQFFTASAVANATTDGGTLQFMTHLAGTYKLSQEGFVDARGCTGTVSFSHDWHALVTISVQSFLVTDNYSSVAKTSLCKFLSFLAPVFTRFQIF